MPNVKKSYTIMSQNKTVFPGLNPEDNYRPNQSPAAPGQAYARPASPKRGNGTIYPGMEAQAAPVGAPSHTVAMPRPAAIGKPIVGFLYSISRNAAGEYWPLHIGQNLIGNSPECDIVLGEGTVSGRHANLHINKMKKPEKTEATLSDLGSTNGTCVNENSVSVARPVECLNGDIITIGENYDLLLLLVDTKALGLHVADSFIDVRSQEEDDVYSPAKAPAGYPDHRNNPTINQQDGMPQFVNHDSYGTQSQNPYNGGARPSDSTVGIDPSVGGYSAGGTVGME